MMRSRIYYSASMILLTIAPFLFTFICGMNIKQVISSVVFAVIYGGMLASGATKETQK